MARALKTFTTSAGFFDLAIAVPSMKAALEAWGAGSNLFHQGFAQQSTDPKIVAATMAKPGVVLRRAVGSSGAFSENAALPSSLDSDSVSRAPSRHAAKELSNRKKVSGPKIDPKAAHAAAMTYEREERRRERKARQEEDHRSDRRRRDKAIGIAQAALDAAQNKHSRAIAVLQDDRDAIDRKLEAQKQRWEGRRGHLEANLRRAHKSHLKAV